MGTRGRSTSGAGTALAVFAFARTAARTQAAVARVCVGLWLLQTYGSWCAADLAGPGTIREVYADFTLTGITWRIAFAAFVEPITCLRNRLCSAPVGAQSIPRPALLALVLVAIVYALAIVADRTIGTIVIAGALTARGAAVTEHTVLA
jgi:hypothetical protein